MTVANPYFINIILEWPNGNLANKNEIARVRAYDVNGTQRTWESECGYDDATGGWKSAIMQNLAVFADREHPNLEFEVWSTAEVLLYTTSIYPAIASGETVTIVIGQSSQTGNDVWVLSGHLTRFDGTPIVGATIEAFDDTQGSVVSLGNGVTTSPSGAYSITYHTADFANNGGSHPAPNLTVKAFDSQRNLLVQRSASPQLVSRNFVFDLKLQGETVPAEYRVFGKVLNSLGLPVDGVPVEAYHLAWSANGPKEVQLGVRVTSAKGGKYEIRYNPPLESTLTGPCNSPVGQINLLVYAQETVANKPPLDTKGVFFDAPKEQEVDLFVSRVAISGTSEFQRISERLSGCLGTTDTALWNSINSLVSRPQYLTFLAKNTGFQEAELLAFGRAWVIAGEIDGYCVLIPATDTTPARSALNLATLRLPKYLGAEPHSPEILYGLVRAGLGDTLTKLLDVRPEILFNTWLEAAHQKIVSSTVEGAITAIVADWKLLLGRVLGTPTTDPNRWQARLINLALPAQDDATQTKRAAVIAASFENAAPFPQLCAALATQGVITSAQAESLVFVFELYDAVGRFFEIVERVFQVRGSTPLWHTVADLAKVTLDQWYGYIIAAPNSTTIPSDVPGNTVEERARVYAARLYALFSGASPDTKFQSELATSAPSGSPAAAASTFLTANPKFDLQTSNIDTFIEKWEEDDKPDPTTVQAVKELQRVYRLTSDYKTAAALSAKGYKSAIQIAQTDEDDFIVEMEKPLGSVTIARSVHRAACYYANEVLFTVIKYNQNVNATGGVTAVTQAVNAASLATRSPLDGYDATIGHEVSKLAKTHRFPNWITLFGDINKCACKHCQTVLSPGAYLVDVLQFIEKTFTSRVSDRRPDIEEIEISCPNTDRMLPYIDLVNEVLEGVVAANEGAKSYFALTIPLSPSGSRSVTPAELEAASSGSEPEFALAAEAFGAHGYILGDRALVKHGPVTAAELKDQEFVVEDDAWHYRIPAVAPGVTFAVYPYAQTSATNDALEVFPEHYNPRAYSALGTAVFPMQLPLMLGKEETAIFLKQHNVYRHEVLEAFTTQSLDEKLTDITYAEAYLGLTHSEVEAILAQRGDLQKSQYWGFTVLDTAPGTVLQIPRPDKPTITIEDTWPRLLALVPVFLHRAAISYQELLELLSTQFLHVEVPGGDLVRVTSLAADLTECNYNNFQLANLGLPELRRASFFLRLWRKLGWSMRDLDRYLMAMEGGLIPTTLTRLSLFKRLTDELKLPVPTVVAFYRNLDSYRSERNRRSSFDEVFLHGAPELPEYRAFERLALYGEGISLQPGDLTEEQDYPSYVRGALRAKSKDFDAIWNRFVDPNSPLGIEQLTNLFRTVTLSNKLKLTLAELDALQELTGFDPLPDGAVPVTLLDAALRQTHAALRAIRQVQALKLPVGEANYYLRNLETPGAKYLPTAQDLSAVFTRISALAATIEASIPQGSAPDAEALTAALGKIVPTERVSQVLQAIEGPPATPVAPVPSDPEFAKLQAEYQEEMARWNSLYETTTDPAKQRDLLWRYLAPILPPRPTGGQPSSDLPENLVGYSAAFTAAQRYQAVWTPLVAHLREALTREAALTLATEVAGLDRDTTQYLLDHTLSAVSGGGKASTDWQRFLRGGIVATDQSAGGTQSGHRDATIVFPADGNYRLAVTLPTTNAAVFNQVTFDGLPLALSLAPTDSKKRTTTYVTDACSVKAQSAHRFTFNYSVPLGANPSISLSLSYREEQSDFVPIPAATLVSFDQNAYLKLRKASGLLKLLRLSKEETQYLLTRMTDAEDLNLDALPLESGASPVELASVLRFTDLARLNRTVSLKSTTLFELLSSVETPSLDNLALELECKSAEIVAVQALWAPDLPPTFKSADFWYIFEACRSVALRLDLRIDQVAQLLTDPSPGPAVATTLRNLYRTRFTKDTWKDAFKPHRDELRRRQRDALVGYLTSRSLVVAGKTLNFFNANDLYAYYLIDVQMEPDTLISRLKLALNSVQLFVERIFLGLEPDTAKVDLGKARELWAWMRNYRVWEANRKVFLYPENWVMPELRDDKSEFFKAFEEELLADEISTEKGNAALGNYLEKVAEVSNLEVVGLNSQSVQTGPYNYILHIVGRTRHQPRTFYYRSFQGKQAYDGDFTPWRKIDLEINADVVAPAVFNGRLHLFWLNVQTKQKTKPFPNSDDSGAMNGNTPEVTGKHVYQDRGDYQSEVRLMWSEYLAAEKKWLKPHLSKDRLMDYEVVKVPDREIGKEAAETKCYHLRINEASGEFISIALIKTKEPDSSGKLAPKQLGAFALRFNGHDSFDGSTQDLKLGSNWPVGTVLRHNAAEEVPGLVEGELSQDRLKFLGAAPFLQRTPESFSVYQTNFGYIEGAGFKPFFVETPTKSFFGINRGQVVQGTMTREAVQNVCLQTFNNPQIREVQSRYQTGGPTSIMNRLVQALPVSENYYYNYYNFRSNYYYNYYGNLYLGYHIAGDSMAWGTTQRKFEIEYLPRTDSLSRPFPLPTIEFGYGTPFGLYNWELFFHAPLLIADRLMHDLKFEEAMNWYHYIFDPKQEFNSYERTKRWAMDLPAGSKYWNFLPFFANKSADDSLQDVLGLRKTLSSYDRADLTALIDEWRRNPFNPHLIARQRIVAYQKKVFMGYLDNLIAWGDQLFRLDTFESINRATQLYVLAAELLGQRPEIVESPLREPRYTYAELKSRKFDAFSEALVDVEYMVVGNREQVKSSALAAQTAAVTHVKNLGFQTAYFQIPRNEKLDGYWDTVGDRLFKIRNSMNIDGIKRQLALFEPPIDPALLVRAAAAGIDLSSVLAQLGSPLPLYRFNIWIQKAIDLCNEVKGFGSALLSALEKKDSESLQLLRQTHEIKMLELARTVRQKQVEEAEQNIVALQRSREMAEERYNHYSQLERVNGTEKSQLSHTEKAGDYEIAQGVIHSMAALFALIPDANGGIVGPFPKVETKFKIGAALLGAANASAAVVGTIAGYHRSEANLAGINAGHERRWEDWQFQAGMALKEMDQLDQQILSATIRSEIAKLELANHEQQMEHASQVQTFLQDKFTNEELYQEMVRQLSRTYQSVYKLAYDVAKTAERTFQFELGTDSAGFVQFGYMNSLKMGLLAGEQLIYDLKRMDIAYLERNKREFELQKSISLETINGKALQDLRDKGYCDFELPEVLFDLDHPGHYFRRIKAVRISIPCVTGPHTSVSAKLSLLGSALRKSSVSDPSGESYQYQGYDDPRFVHDPVGIQSIATSSAQNDSGLFELNFRDERYLPFEGSGVISRWRLELPTTVRQFDYDSISDVVLHLSYTARDAGGTLRKGAEAAIFNTLNSLTKMLVEESPTGLVRVFSLRKEFPDVFHQLCAGTGAAVAFTLLPEHFPYLLQKPGVTLGMADEQGKIGVYVHPKKGATMPSTTLTLTFDPPDTSSTSFSGGDTVVRSLTRGIDPLLTDFKPETWTLTMEPTTTPPPPELPTLDEIDDILFVLRYTAELNS